ncbi:TPA: hypothetical protein I8Y21_005770, partial [Klebsiella oxytoca]|nr:hypothetical protein [Klebsiella oxytoca]
KGMVTVTGRILKEATSIKGIGGVSIVNSGDNAYASVHVQLNNATVNMVANTENSTINHVSAFDIANDDGAVHHNAIIFFRGW